MNPRSIYTSNEDRQNRHMAAPAFGASRCSIVPELARGVKGVSKANGAQVNTRAPSHFGHRQCDRAMAVILLRYVQYADCPQIHIPHRVIDERIFAGLIKDHIKNNALAWRHLVCRHA